MSAGEMRCARCSGAMVEGFVVDKGDHSVAEMQTWVEGTPERAFWTGLEMKDRQVLQVVSYRCQRCGYLESYALTPPPTR